MLFYLKETLRNWLFRLFMASRNDLSKLVQQDFSPEDYQQKHIANTTIITVFENDARTFYFRQCREHAPLRPYLLQAIHTYFDGISKLAERAALKQAILSDLQNKKNYKLLTRISGQFNAHLLEILAGVYRDYSAVGLPCFADFDAQAEFIAFIKYISGIIISQKTNAYLPKGAYENFSANKQLATYKLAYLLGVPELITPVTVGAFTENGVRKVGTVMDKAPGYPPSDISPQQRTKLDLPVFLKDLTNLEYLDALCYQLDHRLDNYYVVENEAGQISRVVAFDNDAARTFFIRSKLPGSTYAGCSGVVADGLVCRPYMDKAFANAVCSCTREQLKPLREFMSAMQLNSLWKRIQQLQKAIQRTAEVKTDFLVSAWQSVDPGAELEDKYGCTYYKLYLTDTLMIDREEMFRKMRSNQEN